LLELLNQMDGFDQTVNVKVNYYFNKKALIFLTLHIVCIHCCCDNFCLEFHVTTSCMPRDSFGIANNCPLFLCVCIVFQAIL